MTTDSNPAERPQDAALDAAYDALEAGQPDQGLVEAARIQDVGDRALFEFEAYMMMGMIDAATGALDRAREEIGEDDATVVESEGELALVRWELAEATAAYEAVREVDPAPAVLERLSLLADHRGEYGEADALLIEARKQGDVPGAPLHLDEAAFDAVVEAALAEIPDEFTTHLQNVRIVREPVPFAALVDPSEPAATPPDILGLFVGPTIHDLAEGASAELPPSIYLFQRNLERMCTDSAKLQEEIRITLFHEIGHLLGLDEDEVAGMGLA